MALQNFDVLVIGGGAAGFFTAINTAEKMPGCRIAILERGNEVLNKVRISGGGRCNVTHAEFLPKELVKNYPRGEKELRGPFHSFMTGDTVQWFEDRGVALKTEEDGRMFPVSNSSQSIVDCFQKEVSRLGIQVLLKQPVQEVEKIGEEWRLGTKTDSFSARYLVVTTGSNPKIWKLLERLGHSIVPPVPSLFTFNITDTRIKGLPGISAYSKVRLSGQKLETEGPLLITHWGMSGPAILKLSAWGARELSTLSEFEIEVNWVPDLELDEISDQLKAFREQQAKQLVWKHSQFGLSKRLWQSLVSAAGVGEEDKWADLSNQIISSIATELTAGKFKVHGKSTFKEEFVTAGGVELREVNFKTFESKLHKNLFLAGEVLNIDAITGGFNFQNAWTGGYLVSEAIAQSR